MIREKTTAFSFGNTLRRRAAFASILVASLLITAKLIAYLMTNSVALLSSLFDSASDLMASLITAYGITNALRPPDRKHRFGHGKAEPLAALIQAIFIASSALFLAHKAVLRFFNPVPIENDLVGGAVMVLSIVLTWMLIFFQQRVVKATGSQAIQADRLHYVGDIAVNLAVITSILLRQLTEIEGLDPFFALGITAWLLLSAHKIFRLALAALMDEELPQCDREKIGKIVLNQKDVQGFHDMRTRTDGDRIFIELHVEMDGNMSLQKAHDLTEKITGAIIEELPKADILIHQDPVGMKEFRLDEQLEES